jgi:hypothetical protein
VKIKVVHGACGREVLVHQILESQGHCPWDGKPFNKDYTGVLAGALEAAERYGGALEAALERIAETGGDMTIDENSLLGPLRTQLDRLNRAGEGVRA